MLPDNVFVERILIVKELHQYAVSLYVCNSGLIFSPKKQEESSFAETSSFLNRLKLRILHGFRKRGYSALGVSFRVFEVQKPDLSAPIVAQKIALQIRKRVHFKRCVLFALKNASKE
jgi:hypothetical protein